MIKKAFILGAGLGTRLRPLTFTRPKPLVPLLGKTLVEYAIRHLKTIGIDHIIINTHHLPKEYSRIIGSGKRFGLDISYSFEPQLLDTGGGLKNIEPFIGNEPFIMYNGDIITDIDLSKMIRFHKEKGGIATLLVSNRHLPLHVRVDKNYKILELGTHLEGSTKKSLYAFCGIHILEPEIFRYIPPSKVISIIDIYQELLKKGLPIIGYPLGKASWQEIGNISSYKEIHRKLLKIPFIDKTTAIGKGLNFSGYLSIGRNCVIGNNCSLKDTIIWDRVRIKEGLKIKNCIITDGTFIKNNAQDRIIINQQELTPGGSNRRFFRIKTAGDSIISMHYDPKKKENTYYANILLFLKNLGVNVPELIHKDSDENRLFLEDLGDETLFSVCRKGINTELYKKALDQIANLHLQGKKLYKKNPFPISRPFSYNLYRWESGYFEKNCVIGYFKISLDKSTRTHLYKDFDFLAQRLSKEPRCLVHRDFQSKNIMVKHNRVYLVDFQGLRFGLPHYDLASLLYDPYINLSQEMRDNLYRYYLEITKNRQKNSVDVYRYTAIQRLMQALGAYGYLGLKLGKREFLSFIPQAVKNLRSVLDDVEGLEGLEELVNTLKPLI